MFKVLEINLSICHSTVIIYPKCLTIGLKYIVIGSHVIVCLNLYENNVVLLLLQVEHKSPNYIDKLAMLYRNTKPSV